ncbi:MAG: efflux RND transporter periplasmic adaptor subunit [Acidobacteriota bacterium]
MAMDIPRKSAARRRRIRRITYTLITVTALALVTFGLSRLEPAAPSVERSTVWPDIVERGPMVIQVRGPGTLVPEQIRWITALTGGAVERIVVQPGAEVNPQTVILELSNPQLELEALDSKFQVEAAQADYSYLKVSLESQLLTQQAAAAGVQADYSQARLRAQADEQLLKEGLHSQLDYNISKTTAEELENRHRIEQKRLDISSESIEAQLSAQQARIAQLRALYELKQNQLQALQVRAGVYGVLQAVPVEVGEQVTAGANLARVAEPQKLKAQLRIPETQAGVVQLGQVASIDTRNGVIPGRVSRIDPAAQEGTVTVDVALEGDLPRGARPDLSVDGTIEIERLDDVLHVGRPAFGQADSTISLFKVLPGTNEAIRTQVQLGRSSVTTIEVIEGLEEGDEVILSDTSQWDAFDRIQLN